MIYLIVSALALGMIASGAAQLDNESNQTDQTNETQSTNQSFSITGECMMSPNATEQQTFMTCRYYMDDSNGDMSLLDQMRDWMDRMFGSSNMNQSGQGMGGMQGQ